MRAPIPAPMLPKSISPECACTPTADAVALSPNNPAQPKRRLERREPRPSAGSQKYIVRSPAETVRNVSPSSTNQGIPSASKSEVASSVPSVARRRRSCRSWI
eukprot:8967731-Pyramimonas_sp.AAC.1